jgi:hypothetical protein
MQLPRHHGHNEALWFPPSFWKGIRIFAPHLHRLRKRIGSTNDVLRFGISSEELHDSLMARWNLSGFPFRSFIRFLCMMFYAHSFPRDLRPRQLRLHFITFRFNNRFDTSARQPSIPYLPRHWVPPHCLDFIFCMRIAIRYLRRFHILEVRFTGLCLCKPPVRFGG